MTDVQVSNARRIGFTALAVVAFWVMARSRLFQLGLWTGMLLTVGVLLLYCRDSVLPALLADPGIVEILGRTGSATVISPLVSGGVLLTGSVLGVFTLRELRRLHKFAA